MRAAVASVLENPFAKAPVKVGVLGLGYVGLPLAVAFARHFPTVGFDIGAERVAELRAGHDRTLELDDAELVASGLTISDDEADLKACNVLIVTVPTPIDDQKRPDLTALLAASATVGRVIAPGGVAVYESTVYPGATEEDCVPVIERLSGLAFNRDFFAGYSPERANPGDREHRLSTIIKVTAGSTPEAADFVDALYAHVVPAGTHKASSIRVAEAAKAIENTQRDLNIALINEFALIFNRLGLDTSEVLAAAGTKWNFLKFQPGLVGGHCIGVDPYYLTHKAQAAGYQPEVILAGRRINDGMGAHVARETAAAMGARGVAVKGARVLILGLAFKEDCPDFRNTGVVGVAREFESLGAAVDVHDPWVDAEAAAQEYGLTLVAEPEAGAYDAVVLAVAHRQFREAGAASARAYGKPGHVLHDVKAVFARDESDLRL